MGKQLFQNAIVVFMLFFSIQAYAQDVDIVTYEENVSDNVVINSTNQAKANRTFSFKRGTIIYSIEGEMPDSLKSCIDIVNHVWSGYMEAGDSLVVSILFDNVYAADIATSVVYCSEINSVAYPQSLYRKRNKRANYVYDAAIHINKNTLWFRGIGRKMSGFKNLTYALLRAYANALGFGSNIKTDRRGNFTYAAHNPSVFDCSVVSDNGTYLTKVSNQTELREFIQHKKGDIYTLKRAQDYKLYTPPIFEANKSLVYLDNSSSLMHYDIPTDTMDLTIDDTTIDILNSIGWKIRHDNQVTIIGEGISNTGIASAYKEHKFHIENAPVISEYKWKCTLPLLNGGQEIIESSSQTFSLSPITDENKYAHTIEGDISVQITFEGKAGDTTFKGFYNLTLELKPRILDAQILKIEPSSLIENASNVYLSVDYEGSHYLYTRVVEEDLSTSHTFHSKVPYQAVFNLSNLFLDGYVWAAIVVNNQYGEDRLYIDITDEFAYANSWVTSILKIAKSGSTYNVYDSNGFFLRTIDNVRELKTMAHGLYILKTTINGKSRTIKYIKR